MAFACTYAWLIPPKSLSVEFQDSPEWSFTRFWNTVTSFAGRHWDGSAPAAGVQYKKPVRLAALRHCQPCPTLEKSIGSRRHVDIEVQTSKGSFLCISFYFFFLWGDEKDWETLDFSHGFHSNSNTMVALTNVDYIVNMLQNLAYFCLCSIFRSILATWESKGEF